MTNARLPTRRRWQVERMRRTFGAVMVRWYRQPRPLDFSFVSLDRTWWNWMIEVQVGRRVWRLWHWRTEQGPQGW